MWVAMLTLDQNTLGISRGLKIYICHCFHALICGQSRPSTAWNFIIRETDMNSGVFGKFLRVFFYLLIFNTAYFKSD